MRTGTATGDEVAASADPAAAATALERLEAARPGTAARLAADPALRAAVVAVTAAGPWLARICITEPTALDVLGALGSPVTAPGGAGSEALARLKRLELLRIAGRDLLGLDGFEDVGRGLAGLASRLLQLAYDRAPSSHPMAVVGMGKLGALELNYASDIDLLLVAADGDGPLPPPREFLELARAVWKVDLDLRPEGRAGATLRSVGSYRAYWQRWADVWEFQALIKARPVAGPEDIGREFAGAAAEQLWGRPFGAEELRRVREMKGRAEREVSRRGLADREVKRGRGGIRDIEFALQLLQMVHGRADPSVRAAATLDALAALSSGGYVDRGDAEDLAAAYRFLRGVEHRLQLYDGTPVHTLPADRERLVHLARTMGYRDGATATAVASFGADLRRHQASARAIHERLFFRPLLEVFTGAGPADAALSSSAVTARLAAFGFTDADRTRQAVTELTRGLTRSSRLMQQMLPVLFDWLSESPDPDQGLLGLRTLATGAHTRDRLGELCRESPVAARRLCLLLGTASRFATDLQRHPEVLAAMAAGAGFPARDRAEMEARAAGSVAWRTGDGAAETGLRLFARQERLRIAGRDVLGDDAVGETGAALSDLAETVVATALRQIEPQVPFAVVGMGRLGGREMAYASDLDLLYAYDVPAGMAPVAAAAEAERVAASLTRALGGTTPATGMYRVDLGLRPEGRQGPLARSVDSYAAYYERWAQVWERQALLRGRVVAGDEAVGARFGEVAGAYVRSRPLTAAEETEIRRTKARMERERLPAAEDPKYHLKLGPGSLSDIEWTAQLLQLTHRVEAAGTVEALTTLRDDGALDPGDATTLVDAYRFCERTRNRLQLVRDLPSESLPGPGTVLTTLARSLGVTPSELRNDYARHTRRARRVVERLFYGRTDR